MSEGELGGSAKVTLVEIKARPAMVPVTVVPVAHSKPGGRWRGPGLGEAQGWCHRSSFWGSRLRGDVQLAGQLQCREQWHDVRAFLMLRRGGFGAPEVGQGQGDVTRLPRARCFVVSCVHLRVFSMTLYRSRLQQGSSLR